MANELQQQIDDIVARLDGNDDSLQSFSDDLQGNLDEIGNSIDELNNNSGQLTFPLTQDSIDLIADASPSIISSYVLKGYAGTIQLSSGSATLTSDLITADSIIIYSVVSSVGVNTVIYNAFPVTVTPLVYQVTVSAGQAIFTSNYPADGSTLAYLILQNNAV